MGDHYVYISVAALPQQGAGPLDAPTLNQTFFGTWIQTVAVPWACPAQKCAYGPICLSPKFILGICIT